MNEKPHLEEDDNLQSLLRRWAIYCACHQSPSIAMQGEWLLCPSCCLLYAKQAAIIILRATNE